MKCKKIPNDEKQPNFSKYGKKIANTGFINPESMGSKTHNLKKEYKSPENKGFDHGSEKDQEANGQSESNKVDKVNNGEESRSLVEALDEGQQFGFLIGLVFVNHIHRIHN